METLPLPPYYGCKLPFLKGASSEGCRYQSPSSFHPCPNISPLARPGPGSHNLPPRSESDARTYFILAIAPHIPVLVHVPALAGPDASISDARRGSGFGLLLGFFPFLLPLAVELHFALEE